MMLNRQQVIDVLERHGFQRVHQNRKNPKAIRYESSKLSAPVYVKVSDTRPLVVHPKFKETFSGSRAVAGVEFNPGTYYHATSLNDFPKRQHTGKDEIAYGVDLGFSHHAALVQLLGQLSSAVPTPSPSTIGRQDLLQGKINFEASNALDETERDALVKARLCQSAYRNDLLAYWGWCAVTDCCVPELLRASHIKPWRVADAVERRDPFNGLLLTPNLDLAFDQGLISFDDSGRILLGEDLDPASAAALHITPTLRLRQIEPRHRAYLAWHREHLFRK